MMTHLRSCDSHTEHFIYLQSDDTLASLDLLIIKVSSLFVCIFHSDIDLCVNAFSLSLSDNTRSSD